MDLTETEGIKRRWQEYTEELYKKDLNEPDNHDGVSTHFMPLLYRRKLRRGGKNTQKNCTKEIFMTQIITMV